MAEVPTPMTGIIINNLENPVFISKTGLCTKMR